ncbi:exosome complex exonuclease Rrp41 [Candidatus Micrarchaeota archaeon]|jgi:exosome complex component RRP41|nr:exosome complex exonuclease Rrp41 [Candidatus Micrarchaeota archaeon]
MSKNEKLIVNGKRTDGRKPNEFRPLSIKAHVLSNTEGSALVKWGNNVILAGVRGPRECIPKHMTDPFKAVLKVRYSMAPFSSKEEHGRSGPNRRSIEISKIIKHVFENVVILEKFPKSQIEIYIEVLQSDGGTRCAAITAAAVALADAGIPMKDLVQAIAVGKVGDTILLDLNYVEDSADNGSDMPIAVAGRNKEVLAFQMDGMLTKEDMSIMFDMAFEASEKIKEIQIKALEEVYFTDEKGETERYIEL